MIERTERLLIRILPWPTAVAFLVTLWAVFAWVPTEKHLGIVQRIFYYHVPSAWVGFIGIFIACVSSMVFLYNRRSEWDRAAHAGVEVGVLFATIVLITGPFWARASWGTWWTWDSRLTTTLILWLIFVAYLLMRQFTEGSETGARFAAVLAIVGTLDIPLIILSTKLWRTIHPAVLRTPEGGSGLNDPSMIATLLICLGAFTMLFGWLWALRLRTLRLAERIDMLRDDLETGVHER